MKTINKIFLVAFLMIGFLFQSCETTELERLDDPNNLTVGDPQFLLNNIQTSYRLSQVILNDRSSELTRIDYFFGDNYLENTPATRLNTPWSVLYSTIITDIQAIELAKTEDNTLAHHLGMAKIMQAHLMMQLVDFLGDIIPLKDADGNDVAGNPSLYPEPSLTNDNGLTVYNEALALLDESISLLNQGASTDNVQDLYYGNRDTGAESDASKWVKLANTLKMRAALTTGDTGTFTSLSSNADNYISSPDDDFYFSFGTALAPVNTQHQDYQNDYTPSGASIYQSNWLLNLMDTSNDPRIRYYFYRQNDCTPGAACDPDGDGAILSCSIQNTPTHLINTNTESIWCFLENGYWGRLHGDPAGTPPDEFSRTAVGVYPAAGLFDDDSFGNVGLGAGGNGAGIEPIILSSYVDFWLAEIALDQGQASAADHLRSGLEKSMDLVTSFSSVDGSADLSFEPSNDDIAAFINDTVDAFESASGDAKWNILAEQYFVTLFGGGADAHNFYRRTGYPTTVSLNFADAPGAYPRTFLYPNNEVTANPNVIQRLDLNTDGVFWQVGLPQPSAN